MSRKLMLDSVNRTPHYGHDEPEEDDVRAESDDTCPRCGAVGTRNNLEPFCRSPECMGDLADIAHDMLGDR